jgi:hypothetical protein
MRPGRYGSQLRLLVPTRTRFPVHGVADLLLLTRTDHPGRASADDVLAKVPVKVFNTFNKNGDETGVLRFKELILLGYA